MDKLKLVIGNKNIADIICKFDEQEYTSKPSSNEIAKIKNRIQDNIFTTYRAIQEIQAEITKGKTCIPSGIKGEPNKNFKKIQLFLVDIDNKMDGKEITADNPLHITKEKILQICERENLVPTFIYTTFSHTPKQNRFRLVYVLEEPLTNYEIAKQIPIMLLDSLKDLYPDTSKKNLSDLFYGGKEIIFQSDNFYKIETIEETKTVDSEEVKQEYEEELQIVDIDIEGQNYLYRIPAPFFIIENGKILYTVMTKDGEETKKLSHLLVFITSVIHNLDSGEEKLELAVRIKEKWKKGIFLKSQVYGNPIELANFGIPINSSNSRWFVKYLAELEAENQDTIPVIEAVTKLGWRNGHFIPFSTDKIRVDIDYKLEKWVNAYASKGTLQEWIEAIRPYRKNKLFRFILASSFTAPLLTPLGHRIFMVFNWGNSRAGKTAALKGALSVWGNAEDLTCTFNSTNVRHRKACWVL